MSNRLLEAPADTANARHEVLGYIDGYDAPIDTDYAFLAYKETEASGAWRVRIMSKGTTGVVFEPEPMRLEARRNGAQGKPFFTWGNGITPSAGDARHIEFRMHVKDGRPSEVEILLRLRKFDGSADEPKSLRFAWPA